MLGGMPSDGHLREVRRGLRHLVSGTRRRSGGVAAIASALIGMAAVPADSAMRAAPTDTGTMRHALRAREVTRPVTVAALSASQNFLLTPAPP
jgi:hypothetical protein